MSVEILPGADHSLTLLDSQRRVVEVVRAWAASFDSGDELEAPAADMGDDLSSEEETVSISI
jgi:hypothetical protein